MRINLKSFPKDLKGNKLRISPEDDSFATFAFFAVEALLALYQDERATGHEKMIRYQIAQKINGSKNETDLTPSEVAKLEELMGKFCSPLIVGQFDELIKQK